MLYGLYRYNSTSLYRGFLYSVGSVIHGAIEIMMYEGSIYRFKIVNNIVQKV